MVEIDLLLISKSDQGELTILFLAIEGSIAGVALYFAERRMAENYAFGVGSFGVLQEVVLVQTVHNLHVVFCVDQEDVVFAR